MHYVRHSLALVFTMAVMGCGSRETIVQASFQPYYQEFMEATQGRDHNPISHIRFAHAGDKYMGNRAGVCLYAGFFSDATVQFENEIRISKGYWNKLSDGSRAVLVFHELVHCSLGYSTHDDTELMGTALGAENYTRSQAREMLELWLASH